MRLGYSTGYANAFSPFFCPRVVAFPGQQNLRTSGCIPPKRSRAASAPEPFIFHCRPPSRRHLHSHSSYFHLISIAAPRRRHLARRRRRHRRTPYPAAAADAVADDNGVTASSTSPPWAPPVMAYTNASDTPAPVPIDGAR